MNKFILVAALSSTLAITASAGGNEIPKPGKAPVLRTMKAVGRVMKFSLKQKGDSIDLHNDEICKFEMNLPVLDLRQVGVSWDETTLAECKSTMNGKPVRVMISGYAAETRWSNPDNSKEDAKIAQASLFVRDGKLGNQGVIDLDGYVGTKDIRATSLILFLKQAYQPGQSQEREEFSATLELQDD